MQYKSAKIRNNAYFCRLYCSFESRIMRKLFCKACVFTLLLSVVTVFDAMSQRAVADTSIVQYLERSASGGRVQITQPAELSQRVARVVEDAESSSVKVPIYRIQLFSSNNSNAKDVAEKLKREFLNSFPDMPATVSYVSPFWRLRVGEFRTHEEASAILPQIQRKFPEIERGMLIMRERVSVQVRDYSND